MSLDHTKDGCVYFKFEHNKEYRQVQMNFWEAVASLNPENIVVIISVFNIPRLHQLTIQVNVLCRPLSTLTRTTLTL